MTNAQEREITMQRVEITGSGTPYDGTVGQIIHSYRDNLHDVAVNGVIVARALDERFLSNSDKPQRFPPMPRGLKERDQK